MTASENQPKGNWHIATCSLYLVDLSFWPLLGMPDLLASTCGSSKYCSCRGTSVLCVWAQSSWLLRHLVTNTAFTLCSVFFAHRRWHTESWRSMHLHYNSETMPVSRGLEWGCSYGYKASNRSRARAKWRGNDFSVFCVSLRLRSWIGYESVWREPGEDSRITS